MVWVGSKEEKNGYTLSEQAKEEQRQRLERKKRSWAAHGVVVIVDDHELQEGGKARYGTMENLLEQLSSRRYFCDPTRSHRPSTLSNEQIAARESYDDYLKAL